MFSQAGDVSVNGVFDICQRFGPRFALGDAARQVWTFGDEDAVFVRLDEHSEFHGFNVKSEASHVNPTVSEVSPVSTPATTATARLRRPFMKLTKETKERASIRKRNSPLPSSASVESPLFGHFCASLWQFPVRSSSLSSPARNFVYFVVQPRASSLCSLRLILRLISEKPEQI